MSQEENKTEIREAAQNEQAADTPIAKIGNFFKKIGNFFKNIPWQKSVSPVVGYSIVAGVFVLAVVITIVCGVVTSNNLPHKI